MSVTSQTEVQANLPRAHLRELSYRQVIDEICGLSWPKLTEEDLISVAWAYYHFSVQFRESLEIARDLYPDDDRLLQLDHGERDTNNLSPWPGVAEIGEKMNHDEFMRRTLDLLPIDDARAQYLVSIGEAYLANIRRVDRLSRALSITSYEDGGLERVFGAILEFDNWNNGLLRSFE